MDDDILYYLGFNRVPGIGPMRLDRIVAYCGGLAGAWHASAGELMAAGLDNRTIETLLRQRREIDLDAEYDRVIDAGVRLISRDDPAYPPLLAQVPNAPFLLYMRGTLTENDRWGLAVVGTRQPSAYGKEVTRKLVQGLVSAGVTIISGLALGIDAVAHETALEAGGRTIAVLGSGVDHIYPLRNLPIGNAIMRQGAIISEYPLGTLPTATNFPPRNRLISGMALGVLVVEAALKSGALITAQFAAEQGRDVFAVPGSIFSPRSEGAHRLIRDGALLAAGVDDILAALDLQTAAVQHEFEAIMPDTPDERALLALVEDEPRHIDDLRRQSGMQAATVSATMTLLELKGLVRQVSGMHYVLARETRAVYSVND